MKRFLSISAVALILMGVHSCEKDEMAENKEKISGKWIVSGESIYKWFEFDNCGNFYIEIKRNLNNPYCIRGIYIIKDSTTVELLNFGSLTISTLQNNTLNFILTPTGNNLQAITTLKAPELESTNKTDLLCTTWRVNTINDENYEDVNGKTIVNEYGEFIIWLPEHYIFTNAGSLYIITPSDDPLQDFNFTYQTWKWNDDETSIITEEYVEGYIHTHESKILDLTSKQLILPYKGYDYEADKWIEGKQVLLPDCSGK